MAWLDGFLQRLYNNGNELELLGGLDFRGFSVTTDLSDPAAPRYVVSATNVLALTELNADLERRHTVAASSYTASAEMTATLDYTEAGLFSLTVAETCTTLIVELPGPEGDAETAHVALRFQLESGAAREATVYAGDADTAGVSFSLSDTGSGGTTLVSLDWVPYGSGTGTWGVSGVSAIGSTTLTINNL